MRNAFIGALTELAEKDDRIYLVVGDLGFGMVQSFAERFPKQFLNVGVAEQNMIGIAAGIALTGKTVFAYSITNFATFRCLEQIRNDVCYHNADVKIVSVGAGFSYGVLGMSHHTTEDVAVMRALPNMTVVAPGDPLESEWATRALAQSGGPAYLRLGRTGEPRLHREPVSFHLGKAIPMKSGQDITLIAAGGVLETALQVSEALQTGGWSVRVLSMPTLKPLDTEAVLAAARETGAVISIEEHSEIGGLGSAVADVLAQSNQKVLFKKIAIPSVFSTHVGDQEFLRQKFGLTKEEILSVLVPLLESLPTKTNLM